MDEFWSGDMLHALPDFLISKLQLTILIVTKDLSKCIVQVQQWICKVKSFWLHFV